MEDENQQELFERMMIYLTNECILYLGVYRQKEAEKELKKFGWKGCLEGLIKKCEEGIEYFWTQEEYRTPDSEDLLRYKKSFEVRSAAFAVLKIGRILERTCSPGKDFKLALPKIRKVANQKYYAGPPAYERDCSADIAKKAIRFLEEDTEAD